MSASTADAQASRGAAARLRPRPARRRASAVTADRERTYLEAVAAVGLDDQPAVYYAGRATLCASPADLDRYDLVYAAWFSGQRAGTKDRPPLPSIVAQAGLGSTEAAAAQGADDPDVVRAQASSTEVLRHRDVATLTRREREALAALFGSLRPARPAPARAPATRRRRRGAVDAPGHAALDAAPDGGARRGRAGVAVAPGRARSCCSSTSPGSMSGYADALIRLAHVYCVAGVPVEVFTLGTRLTQITRPLHQRDPDRASWPPATPSRTGPGGTRLAEGVKAFLDRWGRRGMARGAVVVVFSDGWERDQPEALGEQVRRLRAVAHRVVWVNPHRGRAGYEPVQGGIMAVLPHVDHFVAGHSHGGVRGADGGGRPCVTCCPS